MPLYKGCKPPLLKGGGPPKAVEGFNIKLQKNPPVTLRVTAPFDKGAFRQNVRGEVIHYKYLSSNLSHDMGLSK